MQIDPRRLAVLGAVANAGGVLAAATVLHLTPSAVSQHIARLEAETGVLLLDRSRLGGRRAAGLTPAGRLLAAYAERLAETLATAERDLAALTGQVTGPVSVGAFPTAIRHLVAPAATAVAATNPNIEVRIRQIEPEPGLAALQAGGLDLLIVEADPADPTHEPARSTRRTAARRPLPDRLPEAMGSGGRRRSPAGPTLDRRAGGLCRAPGAGSDRRPP
jgi:DNA-binding transcriptional LysR family regulator